MGGALAQRLAVLHPRRVVTLTLMSTSPDGPGGPGRPDLPPVSEALARWFAEPRPAPDWADRDAVIAYFLAGEHAFAGRIPVDEERLRATAGRAYDRSPVPAAASNHWSVEGASPFGPASVRSPRRRWSCTARTTRSSPTVTPRPWPARSPAPRSSRSPGWATRCPYRRSGTR